MKELQSHLARHHELGTKPGCLSVMKYVNLNSSAMTMPPNHVTEWVRFASGAAIIGIITYFVATQFHVFPLWAVALAVFMYATIIMLSGMYVEYGQ